MCDLVAFEMTHFSCYFAAVSAQAVPGIDLVVPVICDWSGSVCC